MRKVVIDWSYPMEMDRILNDIRMSDIGLYYITCVCDGEVSDLYIGKTIYSYKSRLMAHKWDWLNNYPGRKDIRLGKVSCQKFVSEKEYQQLISDAESTLIFCCREQLIHNSMGKNSCNPSQRLHIFNTGRRGNLPAEVYISDEEWFDDKLGVKNMFEEYNIEQIRLLPMGKDEKVGFTSEEAAREFFDDDLSENGIYYYGKKGLDICDQDTLILFQYNGYIIGYGVLKTRNYEEGYYQFYPESIHNVEKISSVEFRAVYPDFKRFGQGMASIDIELLEPISILLKIKQAVFGEGQR